MITLNTLQQLSFIYTHEAIQGGYNLTYTHPSKGLFSAHLSNHGILNINSAINSSNIVNLSFTNVEELLNWIQS